MSEISRICPHCGKGNLMEARHCAHCGADTQAALPVAQRNLPVSLAKVALPVLAGAASLALRAGWKLLQNYLAQRVDQPAAPQPITRAAAQPIKVPHKVEPAQRPTTRIHIRSTWAVGDARGNWRQGSSEHTIEIEE